MNCRGRRTAEGEECRESDCRERLTATGVWRDAGTHHGDAVLPRRCRAAAAPPLPALLLVRCSSAPLAAFAGRGGTAVRERQQQHHCRVIVVLICVASGISKRRGAIFWQASRPAGCYICATSHEQASLYNN